MSSTINEDTQTQWNAVIQEAAKRSDTVKTDWFPLPESKETELIKSPAFAKAIANKFLNTPENQVLLQKLLSTLLVKQAIRPSLLKSDDDRDSDAQSVLAKAFKLIVPALLLPPKGTSLFKKGLALGTAGALAAAGAFGIGALSDAPQTGLQTAPVFAPAVSATPFPTVAGGHYFKEPSTALVSPEAPSWLLDTLAKQSALDTETLAKQRALHVAEIAKQRVLKTLKRKRAQLQRAQEVADEIRTFPKTEDDVYARARIGESVAEEKAEEEMAPIRQAEKAAKAAELQAFQSSLNNDFIVPTFPHAFSNLLTMQKARVIADFVKGPLTNLATSYKYVPLSEIIELHLIGNDAEQTLENYDKWVASLDINADSLPAKAIETDDKKLIHTNYAGVVNYFLNFLPTEALANEIDNQIITDIRTNLIALRDAPWLYGTEYPVFDTTKRNQIISNLNSDVGRIRLGSLNSALRSLGGRVQKSRSKRSRSRRQGRSRRHRSRSRSGKRKSHKSPRYYAYM